MKKGWLIFSGITAATIVVAFVIPPVAASLSTTQIKNNSDDGSDNTYSDAVQPHTPITGGSTNNAQLPNITTQNYSSKYFNSTSALPETTGNYVTDIAYLNMGIMSDYNSSDQARRDVFQNDIENTFLFTGGADVVSDFSILGTAKNFIGLFEENVRWNYTYRNTLAQVYSMVSRFTFSTAKNGQTISDLVTNYDQKVGQFDPQNIVYVVGREDIDKGDNGINDYQSNLQTFVEKALEERNNTATVQIIKHWYASNTYTNYSTFNANADKYNSVVDSVVKNVYTSNPEAVKRILVVNPVKPLGQGDGLIGGADNTNYASNGMDLSRIGNNYLALLLMLQGNPTIGTSWDSTKSNLDASNYSLIDTNKFTYLDEKSGSITDKSKLVKTTVTPKSWTDYSKTLPNAKAVEWSYTNDKNNKDITSATIADDSTNSGIKQISVVLPDGAANDNVSFSIEYPDTGVIIKGKAKLDSNKQFVIDGIPVYDGNNKSPITKVNYTNNIIIKVFGKDNTAYNAYKANISTGQQTAAATLNPAQQKFMSKFNNKNTPLKWGFLGDSIDHGLIYTYGFDDIAKVAEKSVKQDWGRVDDTFINVAMNGDFTNRAVDPYLINSRISKYKFDVLSINLGVSDGLTSGTSNGQSIPANKEQYQNNMKTLIAAAKAANPDVVIVLSSINPNGYNVGSQNRIIIPEKYNPYLKELVDNTPEYKDYVIYNPQVHDELNKILQQYPWSINDMLFIGSDKFHPSADAHLIKGKSFLNALGVDTDNSYLSHYFLQQFTPYTTNVQNIRIAQSGNTIVPDFRNWVATKPANTASIGQIFTTISPSTSNTNNIEAGKTSLYAYYILTAYNSPADGGAANNPDSNTITNDYIIPYLKAGTYNSSFWSTTRVRLSNSAYNSISAASASTLTIPTATKNS
ncbi:MAG: SGNH/GDSL hydrolase family protein [Malacoplasma sp.]|nr:SGNH/GDSL hydrolase family protein [Malacoplasma sp.]